VFLLCAPSEDDVTNICVLKKKTKYFIFVLLNGSCTVPQTLERS